MCLFALSIQYFLQEKVIFQFGAGYVRVLSLVNASPVWFAFGAIRWHSRLTLHFLSAAVSRGHRQGTKESGSGFTPFRKGNAIRRNLLGKIDNHW